MPHPNFIKVDFEGAEVRVLQGADMLLSGPNPPRFLIELYGETVEQQVREILGQAGYSFYTLEFARIQSDCVPRHVLAFLGDYESSPT